LGPRSPNTEALGTLMETLSSAVNWLNFLTTLLQLMMFILYLILKSEINI